VSDEIAAIAASHTTADTRRILDIFVIAASLPVSDLT
jgi:hypothetical protein